MYFAPMFLFISMIVSIVHRMVGNNEKGLNVIIITEWVEAIIKAI